MSVLFADGADGIATADVTAGVRPVFDQFASAIVTSATTHGSSTHAFSFGNAGTSQAKRTSLGNNATMVLEFWFKCLNTSSAVGRVFACFSDGDPGTAGNVQVGLALSNAGNLQIWRNKGLGSTVGGTQLGSNSTNALSNNTWYHIGIVATFHNSAGTVEVYVDDTKTNWIDLTSQDTQQTANAYANAFGLAGQNANTDDTVFDDIVCDTATRRGPITIVELIANGNGATNNFTPSAGLNYQNVDDSTPNSDTDYNESTGVGNIDLYEYTNPSSLSSIEFVKVSSIVKQAGAGSADVQNVVRVGTTNYLQTQRTITTSYGATEDILEVSPATSVAWTGSEVISMQAGCKHSA
jgi:hypothetical protein